MRTNRKHAGTTRNSILECCLRVMAALAAGPNHRPRTIDRETASRERTRPPTVGNRVGSDRKRPLETQPGRPNSSIVTARGRDSLIRRPDDMHKHRHTTRGVGPAFNVIVSCCVVLIVAVVVWTLECSNVHSRPALTMTLAPKWADGIQFRPMTQSKPSEAGNQSDCRAGPRAASSVDVALRMLGSCSAADQSPGRSCSWPALARDRSNDTFDCFSATRASRAADFQQFHEHERALDWQTRAPIKSTRTRQTKRERTSSDSDPHRASSRSRSNIMSCSQAA